MIFLWFSSEFYFTQKKFLHLPPKEEHSSYNGGSLFAFGLVVDPSGLDRTFTFVQITMKGQKKNTKNDNQSKEVSVLFIQSGIYCVSVELFNSDWPKNNWPRLKINSVTKKLFYDIEKVRRRSFYCGLWQLWAFYKYFVHKDDQMYKLLFPLKITDLISDKLTVLCEITIDGKDVQQGCMYIFLLW